MPGLSWAELAGHAAFMCLLWPCARSNHRPSRLEGCCRFCSRITGFWVPASATIVRTCSSWLTLAAVLKKGEVSPTPLCVPGLNPTAYPFKWIQGTCDWHFSLPPGKHLLGQCAENCCELSGTENRVLFLSPAPGVDMLPIPRHTVFPLWLHAVQLWDRLSPGCLAVPIPVSSLPTYSLPLPGYSALSCAAWLAKAMWFWLFDNQIRLSCDCPVLSFVICLTEKLFSDCTFSKPLRYQKPQS